MLMLPNYSEFCVGNVVCDIEGPENEDNGRICCKIIQEIDGDKFIFNDGLIFGLYGERRIEPFPI